jgi:hypothetical protein
MLTDEFVRCDDLVASVVITSRRAGAIVNSSWGWDLIRNLVSAQGAETARAGVVDQRKLALVDQGHRDDRVSEPYSLEKPL